MSSSQENDQRTPLVAPVASAVLPVTASPLTKLRCAILTLLLLSASFIAALNVSQEKLSRHGGGNDNHSDNGSEHHEERVSRSEMAALWWKCALLLLGICAFAWLLARVVVDKTIGEAVLTDPVQPDQKLYEGAVAWCLKMPHHLVNSPTTVFNAIFVLFSILGVLFAVMEYVISLVERSETGVDVIVAETFKCFLTVGFALIQLYFFWMHSRVCLQWKLDWAWLAFSAIISVNLSCWFFHTGFEIVEAFDQIHKRCLGNIPEYFSVNIELEFFTDSLAPFLSECFLMGAILSGTVLSNAGRYARVLGMKTLSKRPQSRASLEALKDSISEPYHVIENSLRKKFRRHGVAMVIAFTAALVLVLLTIVVKPYIAYLACKHLDDFVSKLRFNFYVPMYAIATLVCAALLLAAYFMRHGEDPHPPSAVHVRHSADRLMLWCALAAIVAYRLQHIWYALFVDNSVASRDQGIASGLNIIQSVLQVIVIECTLAGRIRNLPQRCSEAFAWTIIIVNGIKWFYYANVFSLVLHLANKVSATNVVLVIITMPLQVFFNFHSIGCLYEFKGKWHMRPGHLTEAQAQVNASHEAIEQQEGEPVS